MFRQKIIDAYRNLLGWKQHYDTNEINLPANLTNTETGEYYQQKHPALRLDIIRALIPENYTLETYLKDKVEQGAVEMLNDLLQYRQLKQYGKTLLQTTQLLNKYAWRNDTETNENKFVGFQIRLRTATGLQAIINKIGLQFLGAESFNLYLFNSGKESPIYTIPVTLNENGGWVWEKADEEIFLSSLGDAEYSGGVWLLGYYQEDIQTNAINLTDFDWDKGVCGGCNGVGLEEWQSLNDYFLFYPFSFNAGDFEKEKMPDLSKINLENHKNFGLNLRISVVCDLTDFFIENKFVFKNLLAYKVTNITLNDMKYSQQINFIEENIKMMIIRDLEGDLETKQDNITQKYHKELKAVSFNITGINSKCLPCDDENTGVEYGVI